MHDTTYNVNTERVFDGQKDYGYALNELQNGKIELILNSGITMIFDSPAKAYEHLQNLNKPKTLEKDTNFIFS